jgi:hypothetical protein
MADTTAAPSTGTTTTPAISTRNTIATAVTNACGICERMRRRKPHHGTIGSVQTCLLCNSEYCDLHKSTEEDGVCEINHMTYYRNHMLLKDVYPNLEARERMLAARI